jgi:hypothetical protein
MAGSGNGGNGRPAYVDRGGEQVYPTPGDVENAEFYGFLVEADTAAIQTHVCDALFNRPAGGAVDFVPFGGMAMLAFDRLPHMIATTPPWDARGWFTETEAALWVLLEERRSGELYWTLPYIFVDNGYAIATGREIYGFPKTQATLQFPHAPARASFLGTQTIVVPQFTAYTQAVWKPVWWAQLVDDADPGGLYGDVVDLARAVGGVIQEAGGFGGFSAQGCARMWSFLDDLMKRQVPLVFLKQFRAVDDPSRACFQAITTANMRLTGFRGGRPLNGSYAVTVADYPSHPIRRDIGLASETLTARFSFYIHFDFRIETGRQLWAAAT